MLMMIIYGDDFFLDGTHWSTKIQKRRKKKEGKLKSELNLYPKKGSPSVVFLVYRVLGCMYQFNLCVDMLF